MASTKVEVFTATKVATEKITKVMQITDSISTPVSCRSVIGSTQGWPTSGQARLPSRMAASTGRVQMV